ncbi:cyclodeaminase/cyclohydrolase family protein [Anaerosacchariphilus polymeriproducens]|uniref:Sugar ABC transporter substrate-binding protein n=1 Tax=Anaerosacchariphilus polymeriproducens TaxID=1812858 RepID=A0A371AXU3_9FIRM|nr:cyclodeaminase/cyclohydrolase family protein [Anaerosacchariphilus polymeriproducens]RDU24394.1 sugar ABC transporter substrate-binding protein [Anaerosacchariphilus polymeriproducens]
MMYEDKIQDFIEVLSSDAPVPGGGGASALAGSMGMALGSMVANLTKGKKKYASVQDDIIRILNKAKELQERLLNFMEEDARAFEPLSKAYGLPKETKEEQEKRDIIMEEALLVASLTPIKIMETCLEVMELLEELEAKGTRIAISDVGVGIQLTRASLIGASMNVYINTKLMKDKKKAEELNKKSDTLIQEGTRKADIIYEKVLNGIRG